MANGVCHTGYGREINLSLPDLGHPERSNLLREITASVADRDPQLLECLARHDGRDCLSESGGKSPWMFLRRGRVEGRQPLAASHLPVTHRATPAESEQHRATKERIVETASRFGLDADAEVPTANRRSISDALVSPAPEVYASGGGISTTTSARAACTRRSVNAVQQDITPLWVSAADCERWRETVGEKTPLPEAPGQEGDDELTFAEQEIGRNCRAGEEGWFVSDARPIRDLGQPTGGFTLPRMSAQRSRNPMLILPVERAAASAALGCPPWELGPCAECGQLMRRYGRDAAMFCGVCRELLNGR
ncbi:hypothetical protein ACFP51_16495 [Streptomyces pratens]|uniref:Zinc ribbon domain-containing protein n=1 Tax=Streptomyces pratens TaxID=887456 RepID=A0ABW1LTX2_9ACTN